MKTTTTNTPDTNVEMPRFFILEREHMVDSQNTKDLSSIELKDFKVSNSVFIKYDVVLFVDDDGETKLLKNRFGNI